MTRYDNIENHPLNGVPVEALEIAREVLRGAVETGDAQESQAEPIADAVVAELRLAGYLNV